MVSTIHLPYAGTRAINNRFGGRRWMYERFSQPGAPMWGHNGVDFPFPLNTPLLACVDGVLTERANDPTGYGQYGTITDSDDTQWLYGHAARWHVKQGAMVTAGQHIADGDSTGNSSGNHLHFGRRPKGYNRADGYFGWTNPRPFLPLPYRVLLQGGHYPNGGGAPGEAEWTMYLAKLVQIALGKAGVIVGVVGDYLPPKTPPAETHSDWDLYVSIHYDAYQPHLGYTSGCSYARFASEIEHWEADRFLSHWASGYPRGTGIPLTQYRVSDDMRYYYGFKPLTAVTPGVILEHGCGQGDDKGILFDQIDKVAQVDAQVILAYLGIESSVPAPQPEPDGGELAMDTSEAEREAMRPYFELLNIPVNMETALMKRAALARKRQEDRGPAISSEYNTRNRDGVMVARQRFSAGTLDYHTEGASQGETFWGEVILHPEDAA